MNILAVDDEMLILKGFIRELRKIFPYDDIESVQSAREALAYIEHLVSTKQKLTYTFLDIELGEMTGLDLAKRIKEKMPETKIVFCTAYSQYACDAYQIHAIGYILKPVIAKQVVAVLDAMDKDWRECVNERKKDIRVVTFGDFCVYVDNQKVLFEREKAKELFAYLIDRQGGAVTTAEIVSVLWEGRTYDYKAKNNATAVISSLKKSLKQAGISEVLLKTWNHLAVDVSSIKCDVYDFKIGDSLAVNSYRGEYMTQYSWAEFTNGSLYDEINNILNKK